MIKLPSALFTNILYRSSNIVQKNVRYSFCQQVTNQSLNLQKTKYAKHYFNKNEEVIKAISQMAQKYNLTQDISRKFFFMYPAAYIQDSQASQFLQNRIKNLQQIAKQKQGQLQGEIAKVFRSIVFRNKVLGFQMSDQYLQKVFDKIKQVQMTKEQVNTIFTVAPHALHSTFNYALDQKLRVFKEYLKIDTKQSLQIFEACPVLLPGSTQRIKGAIAQLIQTFHFSYDQVINLMKSYGQVFLFGRANIHQLHKLPKRWQVKGYQIKQIFLKNPLLFFNYPYQILPLKVKLIRYLQLPEYCGRLIFTKYPSILVYSVNSLQSKTVFFKYRLRMTNLFNYQITSPQVLLELLTFKFNKTLRPRGQLLLKHGYQYTTDNIVKLMSVSEQQFCKQVNITKEMLEEQKNRFEITYQIDYFKKKAFNNTNLKAKLQKAVSQQYQK